MSLMESLNDNRTKVQIVPSPTTKKGKRKRGKGRRCSEGPDWALVRERERDFSLDLRAIRPSKSFGPRRKAALRGEAYAWTPV